MPTCAIDIYSKAKLENEMRVLDVGGIVVRFSNVIGLGMAKNNVLSEIMDQLSKPDPLIVNNIKPIRDFIWIDDVVDAIEQLIKSNVSGIFNIGTGVDTSIYELSRIFLDITSQKNREIVSIVKDSKYSYNVVNYRKIKKRVGWDPKVRLYQSIQNMVNHL